ncbi:FHA domain-containing protein [Phyllosticta capitalensis]|uniref:FHA domain-containing protein n=2 Tax=Phyllosticta capitalensis TaxID=121624 RepID=A0ABR1YJM1_9PEZI
MFTTPAPSAPTLSTTTSSAQPTSPSRSGRLRGLSYLRSYTHNHLHSHSSDRSTSGPAASIRRPSLHRSRSQSSPNSARNARNHTASSSDPSPQLDLASSRTNNPHGASSGWVPTVVGRSGLSRVASSAEPSTTSATSPRPASMTRNRTESAAPALGAASTNAAAAGDGSTPSKQLPSIRFIPHDDPRATRPSLQFPVISRTLPNEDSVIRVGRYSEKDTIPTDVPANVPSAAPVGFKSKVVSRRHCEFWCRDGQWWIKDVKSSSGTFLNHIRLSQPGVESKPFKVGDGDVVQLGIDFRGGEEMIFRCVKIRIECNRNWQKSLNNFNKSTHKTLRKLAQGTGKSKDSDAASTHSTDCSICLMSVRPCQALFVAPCSHVWHYKCISRVINGPTYPQFMCPNCRMVNDLDADVSEPEDFDDEMDESLDEVLARAKGPNTNGSLSIEEEVEGTATPRPIGESGPSSDPDQETSDGGVQTPPDEDSQDDAAGSASATSGPIPIATPANGASGATPFGSSTILNTPNPRTQYALTPTPASTGLDCPMTPRNDAGPFVLDGSGTRSNNRRSSMDEAVEALERGADENAGVGN